MRNNNRKNRKQLSIFILYFFLLLIIFVATDFCMDLNTLQLITFNKGIFADTYTAKLNDGSSMQASLIHAIGSKGPNQGSYYASVIANNGTNKEFRHVEAHYYYTMLEKKYNEQHNK